jgi:hypothetical protein
MSGPARKTFYEIHLGQLAQLRLKKFHAMNESGADAREGSAPANVLSPWDGSETAEQRRTRLMGNWSRQDAKSDELVSAGMESA